MFQHWIFWAIATALVLVFVFVMKSRAYKDRIKFSVAGEKSTFGFDSDLWEKHFNKFVAAIVIVGFLLAVFV